MVAVLSMPKIEDDHKICPQFCGGQKVSTNHKKDQIQCTAIIKKNEITFKI